MNRFNEKKQRHHQVSAGEGSKVSGSKRLEKVGKSGD